MEKKPTKQLSVCLSEDDYEALMIACELEQLNRSVILRRALRAYMRTLCPPTEGDLPTTEAK